MRLSITIVSMLLLIVAVACGDDDEPRTTTEQSGQAASPTAATDDTNEQPTPTPEAEAPTATREPEPDPTPTEAPTATPELAEAELAVTHHTAYEASYGGSVYFVGVVANSGEGDARETQIVVTLYDDAGNVVGSERSHMHFGHIPAGDITPFHLVLDREPGSWASEDFQVQYASGGQSTFGRDYRDFTIHQANWNAGEVVGQLENTGDALATSVQIMVAGFDAEDQLLYVDTGSVGLDQIQPGMTTSFSVNIRGIDEGPDPNRIDVVAAGYRED